MHYATKLNLIQIMYKNKSKIHLFDGILFSFKLGLSQMNASQCLHFYANFRWKMHIQKNIFV